MLMSSSPLTGIIHHTAYKATDRMTVLRVTTCLERPANFKEFDSCQGNVRGKSCQGKPFIAIVLIGATLVFNRLVGRLVSSVLSILLFIKSS